MKKNRAMINAFLAPAVLAYLVVFLYPTLRTIVMSFFKVESVTDSVSKWKFFGLGNFKTIFSSELFITSLKNIGNIWLIGGISVMVLALLFAVILTSGIKFKSFYRSAIYLPNVVSAVAMGTMWINYIYNTDFGLLNRILAFFGQGNKKVLWLGPDRIFWSMLVAYCFGMVGYHMLIFMAGIERIPQDYYEAATIEGANIWDRFIKITLPLLKGVTRSNIVIWTVTTVGFFVWGQIFSPVNLSAGTAAPMNYMYELVFGSSSSVTVRDSGAGAAIGVLMTLIVVTVFFATTFIVRNDDSEM